MLRITGIVYALLFVAAFGTGLAGVSFTPGCAAVVSNLPAIISAVQTGSLILSAIETFVNAYFTAHPDPVAQAKVADVLVRAKAADAAVLAAAQGAGDINQTQVAAAFADFQTAYTDLLAVVRPYGVVTQTGKAMLVSATQLVVPATISR